MSSPLLLNQKALNPFSRHVFWKWGDGWKNHLNVAALDNDEMNKRFSSFCCWARTNSVYGSWKDSGLIVPAVATNASSYPPYSLLCGDNGCNKGFPSAFPRVWENRGKLPPRPEKPARTKGRFTPLFLGAFWNAGHVAKLCPEALAREPIEHGVSCIFWKPLMKTRALTRKLDGRPSLNMILP